MNATIPEWALKEAQECMEAHGTAEAFALALLARDERTAKEEREACALIAEAAPCQTLGDHRRAYAIASAIRDRSKP